MELLQLLKYRLEVSKKATQEFHDDVKRSLQDYNIAYTRPLTMEEILKDSRARYEFKVPYIFATHESMLSSMFDQVPDLIFRGRGLDDDEKKNKVQAAYDYLIDVVDMERVMTEVAWWFILVGFASTKVSWVSSTYNVPVVDETGEQEMDEEGNPLERAEYEQNDPIVEVDDPCKVYWSPESKFTEDGKKVPYFIKHVLMDVDEIQSVYGKKVEPDATLKVDDIEKKDDIMRANVYFYYGQIPQDNKKDVEEWSYGKKYYIIFTETTVLHKEEVEIPSCALAKWHGDPSSFTGFGIGRTLREFQKELGIRRGQQVRYADLFAFPKVAKDQSTLVDDKALLDPREGVVMTYSEKVPEYLVPPTMSDTIMLAEQKAREDAQFVSGLLDLSKGAQQTNTVETATGQTIFAEAAEKRIRQAKRQFGRWYKQLVKTLLKYAQKYWDDEKLVTITDKGGNQMMGTVSAYDLQDVDFDKDIDIDMESISINKDVIRAQAIDLYNKVKDDPLVDRQMIVKDVLKDGFNKKNPEQYINQEAVDQMNQPQVGEQVGEQPLAEPMGAGAPMDQAGLMGANQ